jgi:hypothetical protein
VDIIPTDFYDRARELGSRLNKWNRDRPILIVGHRDGDGISAASVLLQSLQNLEFDKISTRIILSPEPELLEGILSEKPYDYVIMGDIGAGFESLLKDKVIDFIIADHHPNEPGIYGKHQLNPCEFDMNDERDCSGSTIATMIMINVFPQDFWATDPGKVILCYAIAGAVSDFQMNDDPVSVNKLIAELAKNSGAVSIRKDICIFGRGMYPIHVALNRSGIPGFEDPQICMDLVERSLDPKIGEQWKRIIDLTPEEKAKLMETITVHLLSNAHLDINASDLIYEFINYVYDLEGLRDWDCTLLPDERKTLDAREILHRVNYVTRRGKAELALDLLNKKTIDKISWNIIEDHHRTGDQEVAIAMELYETGKIPIETWDDRIIMADFTGSIFYDEVGVIAGVLMKKHPNIEIMLSSCEIEDEENVIKLSTRAREDIWNFIEVPSKKLSDAKQVYHTIRKKYPTKILQFGGHRWACSGYMKREIASEFFREMVKYHQSLRSAELLEEEELGEKKSVVLKTIGKTVQWRLDQFT